MRQISDNDMRTLLRHLPRVLPAVNTGGDIKIYNSARLLYQLVRKFDRIEAVRENKALRDKVDDALRIVRGEEPVSDEWTIGQIRAWRGKDVQVNVKED